ncbi:hypothetical protein [Streptomyces sp. NPDC002851]
MSEHVHVRLRDGVRVTADGELVELSHCRCGATWARTYRVADGAPEE